MKRFILAALLLLCPALAPAADPTPDQIQALVTATTTLQTDVQADTAQIATVGTDTAAVNAAQATLAADTAIQAATAAKVQTDVQAVITAAQALAAAQAKALPVADLSDSEARSAIIAGFEGRIILGRLRPVALVTRAHKAELLAAKTDGFKTDLGGILAPSPARACKIATYAVFGLEIANAFGANIPPEALAAAILIQQQACNTPAPAPTPTKAAKPCTDCQAKYATGLTLAPLPVRRARHEVDLRKHAIHMAKMMMRMADPIPASYDCRNLCGPILDQGQCGSCWCFSGVSTIQAANIKTKSLDNTDAGNLSEQFILDTCGPSNGGCGGDDATTIFDWAKNGGGVPLTSIYGPYQASAGNCSLSTTATGYRISDWGYCSSATGMADTGLIKAAMLQYGPISVCIAADQRFIGFNGGSVFKDSGFASINHQIVLVGWDDAKGAWLLRNSWGTGWADAGYCWIAYGANQVGTEAMWVVAGTPVVLQPAAPQPTPAPTPTRRAAVLAEKATRLYKTDPATVEKALKAAEDILANAP